MACLICKEPAVTYESGGDWHERNCVDCGRYRISRTLVDSMAGLKQSFDVERTRTWIGMNRVSDPAPLLSTFDANRNQLISTR